MDSRPPVAIVLRTRDDLAFTGEIISFITMFRTLYAGRVDLVVVDTESGDGTDEAYRHQGARVITLEQATFSYPQSLNAGLTAVAPDVIVAISLVGHAVPVDPWAFLRAISLFEDLSVVGAYGPTLPSTRASRTERMLGTLWPMTREGRIKHARMGTFGATNHMIRLSSWKDLPFDETYGAGGEDTAWARVQLERGKAIIRTPLLAAYHSHGLGPINYLKQFMHWRRIMRGAHPFDAAETWRRRPDLR